MANAYTQAQSQLLSFDYPRFTQAQTFISKSAGYTQAQAQINAFGVTKNLQAWSMLAPVPKSNRATKKYFTLPGYYNTVIELNILATIDIADFEMPLFVVIDWHGEQPYNYTLGIVDQDGNAIEPYFFEAVEGTYIVAINMPEDEEDAFDRIYIVSDIAAGTELDTLTGYGSYSIHLYDEDSYNEDGEDGGSREVFAPGYSIDNGVIFNDRNLLATIPGTGPRGIFYNIDSALTGPGTLSSRIRMGADELYSKPEATTGGPFAAGLNYYDTTYYQDTGAIVVGNGYTPTLTGSFTYQIIAFEFTSSAFMQAQVFIRIFKKHWQAQAKIKIVPKKTMMARVVIAGTKPTMQAQAYILGERYLTQYNGFNLPGYAQEEVFDSTENITTLYGPYQDSVFSEYTGLENKIISLRMRVVGDNYLECKNQAQYAATLLRSQRKDFAPLYIQSYNKHYDALVKSVILEADIHNNRFVDYIASFECRPWLIEDSTVTVSGTNLIVTTGRDIYDGGWTPVNINITGENVTISGYTETGDFTGFVSVSGVLINMNINTEEYTASMEGINRTDLILNDNFQVYVGPGITYFDVDGAIACEVTYHNRWTL